MQLDREHCGFATVAVALVAVNVYVFVGRSSPEGAARAAASPFARHDGLAQPAADVDITPKAVPLAQPAMPAVASREDLGLLRDSVAEPTAGEQAPQPAAEKKPAEETARTEDAGAASPGGFQRPRLQDRLKPGQGMDFSSGGGFGAGAFAQGPTTPAEGPAQTTGPRTLVAAAPRPPAAAEGYFRPAAGRPRFRQLHAAPPDGKAPLGATKGGSEDRGGGAAERRPAAAEAAAPKPPGGSSPGSSNASGDYPSGSESGGPTSGGAPSGGAASSPGSSGPLNDGALAGSALDMLKLINKARRERGLQPLGVSSAIAEVAQNWASTMAGKGSLQHHLKGAYGSTKETYSDLYPPGWSGAGENVGYAQSIEQIFNGMYYGEQDSKGNCLPNSHCANIVSPNFNTVGIGDLVSGGYHWNVQDFARY